MPPRFAALVLFALACAPPGPAVRPDERPVAPVLRQIEALPDLGGRIVGAASPAQTATLVVVFASWCGPCRRELALVAELSRQEPRLRVLGLNAYETWGEQSDEARLREFLAANAPWLRVVRADAALLGALGGVPKIPSLFLFDGAGGLAVAWRRSERLPPDGEELDAAIRAVVK